MKHGIRAFLAGIALCTGLFTAAPMASALTADEIIMMSKQGLSEDMLITIIRNATDLPARTPENRAQFEAAGLNARIIEAIFGTEGDTGTPSPNGKISDPVDASILNVYKSTEANSQNTQTTEGEHNTGKDANPTNGLILQKPTKDNSPTSLTDIEPAKAPKTSSSSRRPPDVEMDLPFDPAEPQQPKAPKTSPASASPQDAEIVLPYPSAEPQQPKAPKTSSSSTRPPDVEMELPFAPAEPQQPKASAVSFPNTIGDNTVLAPIESSNVPLVFRKYFEEAFETYTVQAEVARRYATLQSETASERAYDAELPRVLSYRNAIPDNPVGSLESCLSLADQMKPSMDTPLGAALNQCIGLSLEALGAPAMAAAYLDRALQSKAKLNGFPKTLEAFFRTAHASDYTSSAPLRIKEHAEEVDDSTRQAFLYFVGYSLVYGPQPDIRLAKQILANVTGTSIYHARAKILLATLAVRAPEYKFKTGAEYLNAALRTLEPLETGEAFELRNTAWLALARIAFENHAYEMADTFYRKVDVNSHHLRDAMLEDAWGQVFAQRFPEALALTHALKSPNFKLSWLPDLPLLEASAYLGLCRYDLAEHSLETLKQTVLSQAAALKSYMARVPQKDYYNQILKHAGAPDSSLLPDLAYRRVLSDSGFRALHRSLRALTDERQALSRHVGPGFLSWPKLQAVYDEMILERQQQMAIVLSGIFDSALTEIHALDISASQIAIEIRLARRQREAECLKIVAAGGQCNQTQAQSADATFTKRANDAYWTFDGEFWRDELWSFKSGLPSACE
ncbi:MAG: hypothetical protein II767_11165 [Proteobacteria bacterium]|nr:hypothetical protein [Pseudomonadota bacterium]MBQ4360803.1 hypothetical protein [Pseudomonadota bacterium]